MHSTDDLEDGYFGSGKIVNYSVNKHGIENHKVEILEFLPSREELKKREAEVVNEELLNDPLCMNLKFGGEGGWEFVNENLTDEERTRRQKNGANSTNQRVKDDPEFAEKMFAAKSKMSKARHAAGLVRYDTFTGKSHSEKTKAKMRESHKRIHEGKNNGMFGVKLAWIHKEDKVKRIQLNELENYLSLGWERGQKPKKEKESKPRVYKRNLTKIVCKCCGIEFEASQRDVRRNRKYCSLSCSTKSVRIKSLEVSAFEAEQPN